MEEKDGSGTLEAAVADALWRAEAAEDREEGVQEEAARQQHQAREREERLRTLAMHHCEAALSWKRRFDTLSYALQRLVGVAGHSEAAWVQLRTHLLTEGDVGQALQKVGCGGAQ